MPIVGADLHTAEISAKITLVVYHSNIIHTAQRVSWENQFNINCLRYFYDKEKMLGKSTRRSNNPWFHDLQPRCARVRVRVSVRVTAKGKGKVWTLAIAPLKWVRLVTSSALQSRKWQLIGVSQWWRRRIMWPSIARANGQLDPLCS